MGKKLTKVQYDTNNTETTLNNLIGALVDVRESLLYWKHEAMSKTRVVPCKKCLWFHNGYCDQIERSVEENHYCGYAVEIKEAQDGM